MSGRSIPPGTIASLRHATRFCTSPDGVGLAYAIEGDGPPLIKAGNWMTHLDYDRQSPVWRHWVRELSRGHTLIRYDDRGLRALGPPIRRHADARHLRRRSGCRR